MEEFFDYNEEESEPEFNHDEILEIFKKLRLAKEGKIKDLPNEEEYSNLINFLHYKDEPKLANYILNQALKIYPKSVILLLDKIYEQIEEENFKGAQESIEEVKIIDKYEYYTYVLEIEVGLNKKNYTTIYEVIQIVLDLFETELDILKEFYKELLELLLDYKLYNHAFKIVRQYLLLDYNNIYGLTKFFQLSFKTKNYQEALVFCEELINRNPYFIIPWLLKANCQFQLNKIAESFDSCQYALAIDDTDSLTNNLVLYTLIKLKKYEEALAFYQEKKSQSILFQNEIVYHLFTMMKKYSEARNLYLSELDILPENRTINELEKIAETFLKEKKYSKAKVYLLQLIKKNPTIFQFHDKLAFCEQKLGNWEMAAEHWKMSLIIKRDNKKTWLNLIECFIKANELKKALSFTILFNNSFPSIEFIYLLSAIYYKLGKKNKSIVFLGLACKNAKEYSKCISYFLRLCPEAKADNILKSVINFFLNK